MTWIPKLGNKVYNIWKKPSKKVRKRRQLEENIRKGRSGERQAELELNLQGWNLRKTGRGSDYEGTRYNWVTGRTEKKHFEIKTGGARLSKLQKKTKKKKKGRYKEYRTEPFFY